MAIAVAIAFLSILFVSTHGWLILVCSAVPLVSGLTGLAGLRNRLGLWAWYILHLGAVSASTVGSALLTGGATSPIFHIIPVAGLLWVTYFPEHRASVAVAPLMAASVIVWSWLDGTLPSDGGALVAASPLIASLFIPLFALRLVETELLHRRQSVIDHLTGCLNRHALASRTTELQAQLELTGETVGVVLFDVDHFKRVNDMHGHNAGDHALQDLSYAVRKRLRRFELFYRLGGEEFLVLLAGAAEEESSLLADAIRDAAGTVVINGSPITVSCGVALASTDVTIDRAIQLADEAMYLAKQNGRNRTVVSEQHTQGGRRAEHEK